jgi:hypothetical protein
MADFRSIQGTAGRFDPAQRTFTLAPGADTDIALWGGGPKGEDLIVVSRNASLFEAYDLRYVSNPLGPNLARIRIKMVGTSGRGLLEACLGGTSGPPWAAAWIVAGDPGPASKAGPNASGKVISIGSMALTPAGNQADFLRQVYQKGDDAILQQGREMLNAGKNEEEVARLIVERRNALKLTVRNQGPSFFKKIAEYRNRMKYGNPVGPSYDSLKAGMIAKGVPPAEVNIKIVEGVKNTSKGFNSAGNRMRLVGTIGEVVGFAITATQNSPASYEPLPKTSDEEVEAEKARLRFGIPAGANIDRHGHLKKSSYLQIDTFDPHVGDEFAGETEEILWWLGVDVTYEYHGTRWTVPGR